MKYTDINTKSLQELNELLKEKKVLLFELKAKLKTMQLTNTSELNVVKKISQEFKQLLLQQKLTKDLRYEYA